MSSSGDVGFPQEGSGCRWVYQGSPGAYASDPNDPG